MAFLLQALPGVMVPALVAGLLALAGDVLARRSAPGLRPAAAALGAALGYLAAHRVIAGSWPPVPFADRTLSAQHWRAWAAPVAGLAGGLLAFGGGARAGWLVRLAVVGLALRATLDARFRHGDAGEAWLLLAGGTAAVALVLAALEWRGAGPRGAGARDWLTPAAVMLSASATALAFQLSRNSSNAQLAGAIASTAGAVLVLALLGGRSESARGATLVWASGLGMAWLEGLVFGRLPLGSALLAAGALAAVALAGRAADGSRARAVLALLLVLGLAAGAVGVAWAAAPPASGGYPY